MHQIQFQQGLLPRAYSKLGITVISTAWSSHIACCQNYWKKQNTNLMTITRMFYWFWSKPSTAQSFKQLKEDVILSAGSRHAFWSAPVNATAMQDAASALVLSLWSWEVVSDGGILSGEYQVPPSTTFDARLIQHSTTQHTNRQLHASFQVMNQFE